MYTRMALAFALSCSCLPALLDSAGYTAAQDIPASNQRIAPVNAYLMERSAEIALARSAAPESISRDAEILVLGARGYERAVEGSNGFVCIVDRGWMNDFDDIEFGSPKLLSPVCLNPAAARTHIPLTNKRTELALARSTKSEMRKGLEAAFEKQELPPPEAGSICYMMSKGGYFGRVQGHLFPHLMLYVPATSEKASGAGLPGSPLMSYQDNADKITVFLFPVDMWSDGTVARHSVDSHIRAEVESRKHTSPMVL